MALSPFEARLRGLQASQNKLVQNERTKLLANALDRASTACVTVGVATPVATYLWDLSRAALGPWFLLASCYVWLAVAWALHIFARRVLGGLLE